MEGGYRSGMLAERWRTWCQGSMWSSSCGITKVTILPCPTMPPGGLACLKLTMLNCGKISFILSSSSLVSLSLPHFLCLGQYCGGPKFLRVNHLYPVSFWILSSRNIPAAQSLFVFPWKSECVLPYLRPEESGSMKRPNYSSDNSPWSAAHTEKYLVEK